MLYLLLMDDVLGSSILTLTSYSSPPTSSSSSSSLPSSSLSSSSLLSFLEQGSSSMRGSQGERGSGVNSCTWKPGDPILYQISNMRHVNYDAGHWFHMSENIMIQVRSGVSSFAPFFILLFSLLLMPFSPIESNPYVTTMRNAPIRLFYHFFSIPSYGSKACWGTISKYSTTLMPPTLLLL